MAKTKIGVIGGSGIDKPEILQKAVELEVDTPFGKPSDKLISGKIGKQEVVILPRHGRGHTIMPTKVPYRANLWALKEVGCTHIIATTACGSLKNEIKPKDLLFIDQFIDFTKHRNLTFFEDRVVHTPMAEPFCHNLRALFVDSAKKLNLSFHNTGTIITIEGPRFSTIAESKLFKSFGADVINMSTVPEVILARELKICYASIAMATDYDSWKENEEPVTWEMIVEVMKYNSENVKKLLVSVIDKVNYFDCLCR